MQEPFLFPDYPRQPKAVHKERFLALLLPWYQRYHRPLPWRLQPSPYAIWISEVMLQQTQMERGVAYFTRWMQQFPDIASLAAASLEEVNRAWEGLGYYARAKNIHAAARQIMQEYAGELPADLAALQQLPGIGPYTAGAIGSMAFGLPVPAVDANVERIFSRLFDVGLPIKHTEAQKFFWQVAAQMLPDHAPGTYNQALMELGALVCKKQARCEICPVSNICQAYHLGISQERPVPGKKTNIIPVDIVTSLLVHKKHIFIQKRLETGAWAGLWEFPGGRIETEESAEDAAVREFMEETELEVSVLCKLGVVDHAYTRYKVRLHCFICRLRESSHAQMSGRATAFPHPTLHAATACRWVRPHELEHIAIPASHRKLLLTWPKEIEEAIRQSGDK